MNIFLETYGCQMNFADSEVVASILGNAGHTIVSDSEAADLILINTCAIRDNAEQRIRHRLQDLRALQRRNARLRVGILGCMAERLQSQLMAEEDNVSLVVGPDAYRRLPELIARVGEMTHSSVSRADSSPNLGEQPGIQPAPAHSSPKLGREMPVAFRAEHCAQQRAGGVCKNPALVDVELSTTETYDDIEPVRLASNGISAYISIMRGCQNYCAYCVVPYTRGRERSRDPETVLREARTLYSQGYKEVTLLGQNVNSYRYADVGFPQLMEAVAQIASDLRVRFATSHPKDLSDDLLRVMAAHPNICRCIHLPVQSGSDRILKLMNRHYDSAWYLDRIDAIRRFLPDCSITTDVIVGFCSETEEEFQSTLDLFRQVRYDYAYMFKYSLRPDTYAARRLADDIPDAVKGRRLEELIALQGQIALENNRLEVGRDYEVLVEGASHRSPERLFGRNSQNKVIVFDRRDALPGQYRRVRVTDCTAATLLGDLIPNS